MTKKLLFLLLLALTASTAFSQTTNTWSNTATSADWNTAANWSLNRVPLATDDVVIGTATNQPVLSTTAVASTVEVQGGASLSISSTGSLSINGSKTVDNFTTAFLNRGTVNSGGQLVLGNTSSVGQVGLWNQATFLNQAGGRISIDRSTAIGFYNFSGSFSNSATLTIGATASVGSSGIDNRATFVNQAGGRIQIDNSTTYGLYNAGSGSFVNSATIIIGASASVGQFGLLNNSSFSNGVGGRITIDRASSLGLFNTDNGSFVNSATIAIGASATVGAGIQNDATFANNTGGSIAIDRTASTGLLNFRDAYFTNSAQLTIGAVGAVGSTGIENLGTFANIGCDARINIVSNAVITNSSSFSNTGTIIENASGNSNISYNGGLVQNLNNGNFTITTNAGILTTTPGLLWTGCTAPTGTRPPTGAWTAYPCHRQCGDCDGYQRTPAEHNRRGLLGGGAKRGLLEHHQRGQPDYQRV